MFTFVAAGHHIFALNENLTVVLCLHNMVLELKFTRFHDQPWGFRLSGGSDFDIPLTVIKVIKDGLAERLGLRVGDIVVRVNDTPTSNLKHSLAQEVILGCGNSFVMALLRPVDEGDDAQLAGSRSAVSVEFEQISAECQQMPPTPDSMVYSDMSEVTINTVSSTRSNSREDGVEEPKQHQVHQPLFDARMQVEQPLFHPRMQVIEKRETDIIDDHIAELLSGEAEVLKEHNVIGVNFHKIIPQAGLFKSSEVFKHLNADAVKTKAEREKDSQRWTTFMQKPDRPIPKSPDQIEMERRKEFAYRIKLDILPKSAAPQKSTSEESESASATNTETVDDNKTTDGETACCDGVHCGTPPCEKCTDDADAQPEELESVVDGEQTSEREDSPLPTPPAKTEDELLVERKLSDIQQQLLALSALPLTIQATLDAVTRQLTDLMPTLKAQHTGTTISVAESLAGDEASNATEDNKSTTASCDDAHDDASDTATTATTAVVRDGQVVASSETDSSVGGGVDNDSVEAEEEDEGLKAEEDIVRQRSETVFRRQEDEWLTKREKEQKRMAEEAARKRALLHPRRPSKAQGGPLTPQGRPVVLPGGRRWRNERDAFNEDFIKEVISSQAELIAGNALGHTFESPLLGYDERVNFLKYKKPEKDLSNLDRSETFKIIHHIEQEPRHGIPVRAPIVLCEEDVRNRAASVSCV